MKSVLMLASALLVAGASYAAAGDAPVFPQNAMSVINETDMNGSIINGMTVQNLNSGFSAQYSISPSGQIAANGGTTMAYGSKVFSDFVSHSGDNYVTTRVYLLSQDHGVVYTVPCKATFSKDNAAEVLAKHFVITKTIEQGETDISCALVS